jgi:quercetin 2,3-dioxygenase
MPDMSQQVQTTSRDAVLVEDAALIRIMGMPVLEAVPTRSAPYELLWLRTGRGAWHAEAIGADEREEDRGDIEFRSVLFWVNLARADKQAEPSALVLREDQIPVRTEGDATVRVLVGEGSPVQLGTPALILDVELPSGGRLATPVPREFQGFAYLVDGEAVFGANRRRAAPPQLVLLGPGEELTVTDATPGTRFLLMAGKPYREVPVFNGPFVD